MLFEVGVEKSSGIAEAFADIIPPSTSARGGLSAFLNLSGFAKFPFGGALKLAFEDLTKLDAPGIAEVDPSKVEEFVNEDKAELPGTAEQAGIENDCAAARKAGSMNGRASVRRPG